MIDVEPATCPAGGLAVVATQPLAVGQSTSRTTIRGDDGLAVLRAVFACAVMVLALRRRTLVAAFSVL